MAQARTPQSHLNDHAKSIVDVIAYAVESAEIAHIGLLFHGELLVHGGLFAETSSDPKVLENKALIAKILSDDVLQKDFEDRLKEIAFFPLTQTVVNTVYRNIRDCYFSCIQAHASWQTFITNERARLHAELEALKTSSQAFLDSVPTSSEVDEELQGKIEQAKHMLSIDEDAIMSVVISKIANAMLLRLISLRTKPRSSQDEEALLELKKIEALKVIFSEPDPMRAFEDKLAEEFFRQLGMISAKLKENEEQARDKLIQIAEMEFAFLLKASQFSQLEEERSKYAFALACHDYNQFLMSPATELTKSVEVLNAILVKHVEDIAHARIHERAQKASRARVSGRFGVLKLKWEEKKEEKKEEKPVSEKEEKEIKEIESPTAPTIEEAPPRPRALSRPEVVSATSRVTRASSLSQSPPRTSIYGLFKPEKRLSLRTEDLPATRKEHVRSPGHSPQGSEESS
jgi:hypothetical protein